MNASTGSRKLKIAQQTALCLLAGLAITLIASGYFKIDTDTCVQAYLIFAGALVGKDTAFVWGNRKEHEAKKDGAS